MDRRGPAPRPLPADVDLVRLAQCSVPFYRYLYGTVGGPYVWWLRRSLPDASLAAILRNPAVSVHVLYRGGEPAGFFELDATALPVVNLSYFGLTPAATGTGLGSAFLDAAVAGGLGPRRAGDHGQHLHGGSSAGAAELPARRVSQGARDR